MAPSLKEYGMVPISMVMEFNNGQVDNIIKGILKIVRDMEKERLYSLMDPIMKVNLNQIK